MKRNIILVAIASISIVSATEAQNTTSLPTSMYGLGELSMGDGGKYSGLGNVAIGLRENGLMNSQNPACITGIDSTGLVFDIGMVASYSKYSMLGKTSTAFTGNLNRFSMGIRLLPKWYTMVGVAPYTSVGYLISVDQEIEGTANSYITSSFEGTGGLYRFYLSNAFLLNKRLSLGVNIGFISGMIEQSETDEGVVVNRESKKSTFYSDFGLHYALSKKWSMGLVYGLSSKLNQKNTLAYDNSSEDTDIETYYHNEKQYIPQRIGLGVTYDNNKITLAGDYNWIQWSRNSSSVSSYDYIDQHKFNVGMIYNKNPERRSIEYMCGIGISNSYITFKKEKMNYLNLNAGIAIPFMQSTVSMGVSWKQQLNTKANLMQENQLSLNFNMTFGERIQRGKIN